ncbi:hypothetical protein Ahy_A04g019150 [Arachis hypogaea]|uniref:CCHC-type domain-containing protein n=1 Tax=Arachis hypogaea TaxID=3818 RepID=A0A445DFH7_ARAHY|nr:hypothetical protein Ahy_A04g019150 [Arachis hypogaea]
MLVVDEASMQGMFSIYQQTWAQVSVIELYVEFEELVEVDLPEANIDWTVYNTESKEKFEGTYHIVGLTEEVGEDDIIAESNIADVANARASQNPSREPSFMHALDLNAMNASEFPEYVNSDPVIVTDDEFVVGIEFSSRETVITAIKDYTIRRGVDYRVIRRYNGSHTCTRTRISQDHAKLNLDMIAEPKFNYMTSYHKAWLTKQKAIANLFGGWEASYKALPSWFEAMNEVFEVREMPRGMEYTIESLIAMSLHVVRTNDLIGNNMFMRARFKPLENPATWPVYQGPRHIPNMYLKRVSKGSPKITHFLNQMDMRDMCGPRHCRLCGDEGHSESRCSHHARSSAGGSAPIS